MKIGPALNERNLVFGYDTGQFASTNPNFETFRPVNGINRFFKGRDSVNYIAFQNPRIDSSYSSYTRGTGTWDSRHPDAITVYSKNGSNLSSYVNTGVTDWSNTDHAHWQLDPILKKPVVVMYDITGSWKAKSFGTAMPSWSSLGLTHGSKYTISWLQWTDNLAKNAKAGLYSRNTSSSPGFHDGQANSPTSYNTKLRTWQRVYQTYTTSAVRDLNSTYLAIYMYGHYNVRATVKIADVQLEIYDHATTYQEFDGSSTYTQTRSSTQSLIDLTKTTDINVSNVSFGSDGLPEFDGSNDYIDLGADLAVSPINQGWTAEYIFNSNSASTLQHFNGCEEDVHNTGWLALYQSKLQVWNRDPGIWRKGSTVFASNTWYHVAFVQESGTSMQFYVNGVAEGGDHVTYSWNASKSAFFARYVGRYEYNGGYSRYFNGHIPVAKFYNKGLSAAEVKQNFNQYKNRFNI